MALEKGNGQRPDFAEPPDAAHYIASLAGELARLAERHELDMLAYILDMARLEADQIAKGLTTEELREATGPN
jgi:hypothetical protein